MLSVNYAECRKQAHYAECHYAECRYAECRGAANLLSFILRFDAIKPFVIVIESFFLV